MPRVILLPFEAPEKIKEPIMRTVIYARFSSGRQNARSIDDQLRDCANRAEAEGWEIVGSFVDAAISGNAGTSEHQRPGFNDMVTKIESGAVDQVLADTTSRICRNQGDAHHFRDLLKFYDARLFTLADGVVDDFKGAVKGLFDEQTRKEIAHNIKRGQRGVVAEGRSPAGLAYGYRTANRITPEGKIIRGLREIDEDQAVFVRRIFAEYADGVSPRVICNQLNAEGVKGPRGGFWRTTTIIGDRKRGNGLLQNQLYIGILNHERTTKRTDPRTRKQLIKPRDREDWISHEVPELQIIDRKTWDRVRAQRDKGSGQHVSYLRRPKHLLSGIGKCGCCGANWISIGTGRWACSANRSGGEAACTNGRMITTPHYEARVLSGLQNGLLSDDAVDLYVREYHRAYTQKLKTLENEGDALQRQLRQASDKVTRLLKVIDDGGSDFAEIRDMLTNATNERDRIVREIAQLEQMPVVALHPHIAAQYRAEVQKLNDALNSNPEARLSAIPKLRGIIEAVWITPHPTKQKGVAIEITGRLHHMLSLASGTPAPECGVKNDSSYPLHYYPPFLKAAV
jgi:site-specific DNA recombinase